MATCPADGQTLIKVPLARVQVLGCPRCRGVWVGREQLMALALEQVPRLLVLYRLRLR